MKNQIFWIVKIITVPLIALICCLVLMILGNPKTSNDDWAYTYLCYQDKTDDINTAKTYSEAARSCASDPNLYNYADKMVSTWDMLLKVGLIKKEEMQSLSGKLKVAAFGISNPSLFPKAAYETYRTWNLQEEGKQLESIYAPQLQNIELKRHHIFIVAGFIFYAVWIGGWVWLFMNWKAKKLRQN